MKKTKYWVQTRGMPWIKKNKIALIVIGIALAYIIYVFASRYVKTTRYKTPDYNDPEVNTENADGSVTGAYVKKDLLSWKKSDKRAIVVCEAAQLVYHYNDEFVHNGYAVALVDSNSTIKSADASQDGINLWGINYGNVLKYNAITDEGGSYSAIMGFLKKDDVFEGYAPGSDRESRIEVKMKTNPYSEKDGIKIPDDERFEKKDITDINDKVIGTVYYPTKIIVPKN